MIQHASAIVIMPILMFGVLSALLVRIWKQRHAAGFIPEFGLMITMIWLQSVIWIAGMNLHGLDARLPHALAADNWDGVFLRSDDWIGWHVRAWMAYAFPLFQLLAVEESLRHSSCYIANHLLSAGKFWICLSLALGFASLAWLTTILFPPPVHLQAQTLRGAIQLGLFAALCWSLGFNYRYWPEMKITSRFIVKQQLLLAMLIGACLISSRPGADRLHSTLLTEVIQTGALIAFFRYAVPR